MLARWTNLITTAALIVLISSSLMVGSAREGAENDGYVLEISVMDAGTGSAVKAFIAVFSGNDIAAKLETSDSGAARALLPPGNYTYSIEARGYQPVKGRFSIVDAAVALTISMERSTDDVSIGVLKAHLMDVVKNIPVPGVMTISHPDGRSGTFKSDERGFVKAELLFGEYKYSVEARGYGPVRGSFVLKEATLEMRVPMKPTSGEDPEPEPYGVIFGTVVGPEKTPVNGAVVHITGLIREPFPVDPSTINADGTIPPDNTYGAYMDRVETDREGHFKFRVPFGPYEIMVEARGYMPFSTSVVVSMEQSEVRVPIMLERMREEPPFPDMRRAVIDLSYVDQDSDGNPEKFHLIMDLDGDMVPELEVSMIDRNSDGNPEELNVHSSLPTPLRMRLMDIIMMLIEDPPVPPFPEPPAEDEEWWGEGDYDGDGTAPKLDWDELLKKLMEGEKGEEGSEDVEDGPGPIGEQTGEDAGADGSTVSDKEGGSDEGPSYLIAAGAIVAIFLLILIVLSLGVVLRMGRKD